jgi:hypothetical protein
MSNPCPDGVVEKCGVHCFTHVIVPAEAKGDVRHSTTNLGVRQVGFDPTRCFDEVNRVVIMLLDASGDCEDIWIEDDVLRWKAALLHEQAVAALTDLALALERIRLPLLVERHDHDRRPIAPH